MHPGYTLEDCLQPSQYIDSAHPKILDLAQSLVVSHEDELTNAVKLYYWVRDTIRYNPYALEITQESFLASTTVEAREAWCVPKAILLAALCRAAGIPARVGFADVLNHMSTERLRETMNTDVFYFHGYTSIYLNGQWVKATPAFNIELCEKFGLLPLEFDGTKDSLYHAFDATGNKHMEYLNDRGEFLDLPFEEMDALFRVHYPSMYSRQASLSTALPDSTQWETDVDQEVGKHPG